MQIFGLTMARLETNSLLVDRLLPKQYDPLMPPKLDGKPVQVEVKISILNIRSIKETELSYIVDIFYHQYWSDYRILAQNLTQDQRIVLDNKWRHKLWIPDSYFKNALSGHVTDIIFPTLYFAVHNQTELFMASRVSLQLSCNMDFSKFPHDTQTCHIDLMSLSHNTQTVMLSWREFYISNNLNLPQFWIKDYSNTTCHRNYAIGNFSCLRGSISLKRELGLYLVKKYIPSILIVVMSFVGFWIPVTAYPARVGLVITALLALITQQHQSTEVNVSYVIALNVWMIVCIAFVFFALIEYAIAIAYIESRLSRMDREDNQRNGIEVLNIADRKLSEQSTASKVGPKWIQHLVHTSNGQCRLGPPLDANLDSVNTIDMISRYLFPIKFIVCILIYILCLYIL